MGCFVSTMFLSTKQLWKSSLAPSELARDDSPTPQPSESQSRSPTATAAAEVAKNPCSKQMWLSLLLIQRIRLVFILKLFYLFPTSLFFKLLLLYMFCFLLSPVNSVHTEILLQLHPAARSPAAELPSMWRNLPFCPQNQLE